MKTKVIITERVKTFEDACEVLGLNPENLPIVENLPEKDRQSIVAYYKLTVIVRALNEGWKPDFSDHNQWKYWNYLWVDDAGFVCASVRVRLVRLRLRMSVLGFASKIVNSHYMLLSNSNHFMKNIYLLADS
jgi:hypothetical protein